jgi:hypothetical protein
LETPRRTPALCWIEETTSCQSCEAATFSVEYADPREFKEKRFRKKLEEIMTESRIGFAKQSE